MGTELVGATLGLGTADLKVVAINTISFVLGLLALVQTVMLLYAGFVLLTVGQDDERRHEAKMTILRSVVGVFIIGVAWAIVLFLFQTVGEATS